MQRACDIGKRNKLDPMLRKYTLVCAASLGLVGLIAGFYIGFAFISNDAALNAPIFEKFFLNTFFAISSGAAGMIIGAFIGSTIYRFKERAVKKQQQ